MTDRRTLPLLELLTEPKITLSLQSLGALSLNQAVASLSPSPLLAIGKLGLSGGISLLVMAQFRSYS